MFKKFILLVLLFTTIYCEAGQKYFVTGDGLVPPKMTSTARDALTGLVTGQQIYNTTTNKLNQYNGTSWVEVGTGVGGINYVSNSDGESGTTGWAAYADAAGTSPVDATGGSPTTTFTTTSSSPLRGNNSFLITKDAANRQGEGASYAFSIDPADKAKVLNVSFDYAVSAAFVSGDSSDVRVWIYDVTNSVLIPMAPYTIQGGTGNNFKFTGVFQSASNSTSYRLAIHIATTNASAWTMKVDNVIVGPQVQLYGAPIGDWATFTPTGTWSANTTWVGYWRRVGDSLQVTGHAALSGAPTGTFTVNVPFGLTIDSSKMPTDVPTGTKATEVGDGYVVKNSNGDSYPAVFMYSSSTVIGQQLYKSVAGTNPVLVGSDSEINATTPITFASGDIVNFRFQVPITGWSSTVLMSNDTDTRVVAARAYLTASQTGVANSAVTKIAFNATTLDTHAAFSTGSNRYVAPVPGVYSVSANIRLTNVHPTGAGTTYDGIHLYKNGSLTSYLGSVMWANTSASQFMVLTGDTVVSLVAGDYLEIFIDQQSGNTVDIDGTDSTRSSFAIRRLSGPSAIAATESVNAGAYRATSAQTVTAGTPLEVVCNTKRRDTHGSYSTSTGRFTAPISGLYQFKFMSEITMGATAASSLDAYILKNGAGDNIGDWNNTSLANSKQYTAMSVGEIYLLAGDYISPWVLSATQNVTVQNTSSTNDITSFYVSRIGN